MEPILVDVAWKTATYVLGGVISLLAGTIVKMLHWWIKTERPRVAADYKENATALADMVYKNQKALDRTSDYLRNWYDKLHPEKASRTEFDFNSDKHKV